MSVPLNHKPVRRRRPPRTLLGALMLFATLALIATLAAIATGGKAAAPGSIGGVVVTGPLIPVDPGSPVGWSPTQAEVLVYRSGTDTLVSTTHSDADGRFALRLAGGSYRLVARSGGTGTERRSNAVSVTLTAGGTNKVRLWFDTGVRFPANQGVACTAPAVPAGGGSQGQAASAYAQGIEGALRIGPIKPVSTPGQPDTKPYAARLSVYRLDGTLAAAVASNAHGAFSIGLPAGKYIVQPGAGGPLFPRANLFSIGVEKGQWRCVTVRYDSGIR